MKIMRSILSVFMLFSCLMLWAGKVETLKVKSPSMNKEVRVVVVTPEKPGKYPVVYMLHGHTGNGKSWVELIPDMPRIADRDGMIFVCPDAENSWYWDSPKNPAYRYETFISKELVDYIDKHYSTIADRKARAITGLSMGGHGAMWISFRHKDIFGAAGSTSGGLDIRPFPNNWNMAEQLGSEADNPSVWEEHTAINQISRLKNGDLALIIDCGYNDFFFEVNNNFHKKLLKYKIDHDFYVRPGAHEAKYWSNSIPYHLLFFKCFFDRNK